MVTGLTKSHWLVRHEVVPELFCCNGEKTLLVFTRNRITLSINHGRGLPARRYEKKGAATTSHAGISARKYQSMAIEQTATPFIMRNPEMIKILIIACCILMAQIAAAQTCKDTITASTPDSRFVINGDEVTDTQTGLIWQRCTLGLSGNDCTDGSANTYTWQEALQAAVSPWRLPSIRELRSIVEEKCYDPAINLTIFPNTLSSYYWSASPYADSSDYAWYVHFNNGYSHYGTKGYGYLSVRLVRGGQ